MYERRIESSMLRTLKELESRQAMRELKERQAAEDQFTPEGGSSPDKKGSLKKQSQLTIVQCSAFSGQRQDEKGDLKKQSQFAPALMGTSSFVTKGYENKAGRGRRANKGKQSQFPTAAPTRRAGKRGKSVAAANSSTG
jgi:hypothetical protein